jgi:hypothetical protein
MTFAEIVLFVAGGVGVYFLLRPIQRRLEHYLLRNVFARRARGRLTTIDVIDFSADGSRKKEDHHA